MKKRYMLILFILALIFQVFVYSVSMDSIWSFGFSYNIATGLIPYKDFNMVITPFYPMLNAILLYIFGKQLIIMYIFNSALVVAIAYLLKKICKNYYLILMLIILLSSANYNLFCYFLLLLIIYYEKVKNNDYIIGLLLAIAILTKQSIGILLLIPTILNIKSINLPKRLIGFVIPMFIFTIYLILTNSLSGFINYAVLGLSDFANYNHLNNIFVYLEIVIMIYLFCKLVKDRKNILLQYVLFFQIIAYPIFDSYHTLFSFLAFLLYFLQDLKLNIKTLKICSIIFITFILSITIITKDYKNIVFANNSRTLKYIIVGKKVLNKIDKVNNYIREQHNDNVFYYVSWAYLFKLESNIRINKYDIINDGNLGYRGTEMLLQKIKQDKMGTIYVINKEDTPKYRNDRDQINVYVVNYITKNMCQIKTIDNYVIYKKC